MPRAFSPTALRAGVVLGIVIGLAAPAAAQTTTIFSSGGFESPYTAGNIVNQQGFQGEPFSGTAGQVQTATTFSGAQAFQVVGPSLNNNVAFTGGNFWYRSSTFASAYDPVADGHPVVQVRFQSRTSGAIPLNNDIPFAGAHLEGYTASGMQQSLTPIFVNLNGGVTVFTNSDTGGLNKAVSTANNLLPREAWNELFAELNFTTQTIQVFKQGESTPLTFLLPGGGTITDVPFRNTNGTTTRIAEIGMLGFYGVDPFTGTPVQPGNHFYMDDYTVTAVVVPVPEPGLMLAVGALGLAGWRIRRRRKAAIASAM